MKKNEQEVNMKDGSKKSFFQRRQHTKKDGKIL